MTRRVTQPRDQVALLPEKVALPGPSSRKLRMPTWASSVSNTSMKPVGLEVEAGRRASRRARRRWRAWPGPWRRPRPTPATPPTRARCRAPRRRRRPGRPARWRALPRRARGGRSTRGPWPSPGRSGGSTRCVPPPPGKMPSWISGKPEARDDSDGHAQVARQRELESPAEREPVDRRDHRPRDRGQRVEPGADAGADDRRGAVGGELGHVGAGGERLLAAGDARPPSPTRRR